MTFPSIVRLWCRQYKFMLDSPRNRRFFLTDSTGGVIDLAKGTIANTMSPCVVMESRVEGGGPFTNPSRTYPVYFFVRAKKMKDGDEATVALEEAWMHACNFLTWLYQKHMEEIRENCNGDYARIDIENTYLDFSTVGPLENGWYGVLVQFDRQEPLNVCIDEDLYIDCCENANKTKSQRKQKKTES